MLKVLDGKLTWGEGDVIAMARVLDADQAVKRSMPVVPSVIQLAERNNVQLHRSAANALRVWRDEVRWLRSINTLRAPNLLDNIRATSELRLFRHQLGGLHFMNQSGRLSYLLADQVGVGKTALALSFIREHSTDDRRVLVVCMNSAKRQWMREIRRWVPGAHVHIIDGTIKEQTDGARWARPNWVIGHWESLVNAADGYLAHPWTAVILDEAHQIANKDTQRANVAHRLEALIRLALTAHPYANGPHELWSILHFLFPTTYTSYWRFFAQHVSATPKPFGGFAIDGVRRPKLLKKELAPFTIQRTKREVRPSLPGVTRVPVEVELSAKGRREYEKLKKEFFVELEAHKNTGRKILAIPSVLARITRLRQYLVDPGLLGAREPSVKYPAVLETLDSLDGPPVIFTLFQQVIPRLTRLLERAGHRVAAIDGTVKGRDRDRAQRDFLKGKLSALLVTAGAGGTSLNLGKYGYVIHLDLPWTARDFEQTEGRVDRPEEGTGISVPTTSYRVIVADSYEERMEAKLERKHDMFTDVFNYDLLKALFA